MAWQILHAKYKEKLSMYRKLLASSRLKLRTREKARAEKLDHEKGYDGKSQKCPINDSHVPLPYFHGTTACARLVKVPSDLSRCRSQPSFIPVDMFELQFDVVPR